MKGSPLSSNSQKPEGTDTLRELLDLGFTEEYPIFEVGVDFDKDLLRSALFDNTPTQPVVLPFVVKGSRGEADDRSSFEWSIHVVVESVKVVFTPKIVHMNDQPLGMYEDPDFYVEGYVLKTAFDSYPESIRVRAYLQDGEPGKFDTSFLQIERADMGWSTDPEMRMPDLRAD